MKDKIKEILEEIDNKIIPNEHWNKIKDYITNLQEENKELKRKYKKSNKLCNQVIKENNDLYEHLILEMERKDTKDKQIIIKSIKYARELRFFDNESLEFEIGTNFIDILNGGDEE